MTRGKPAHKIIQSKVIGKQLRDGWGKGYHVSRLRQ